MNYHEIKQILDTCDENIRNLEAIKINIECRYPKEVEEYKKYYESFIGEYWKKEKEKC